MEDFENDVNSEMRYLTIELMKSADRNKTTFKKMVDEYIKNTFYLQKKIYLMQVSQKEKNKNARKKTKKKERMIR